MKKLLFATLALSTLLLSACGASTTATFTVTFDTKDQVRQSSLTETIGRVLEGRLLAMKKTLVKKDIKTQKDGTLVVTVQASDADGAAKLKAGLTSPFTIALYKEVGKGQGDIISEQFGEFKETGVGTESFDWVAAGPATDPKAIGKGSVVIQFTREGKEKVKNVFAANRGAVVGVFVRGHLMSKKTVDKTDSEPVIAIDGIPSAKLAADFADDVNVSLHATFKVTK